ncbi:MAG TPA: SGNH/GDSL hydrolase family protein [Verrucomicrobiales bacterium]|jgi:lysophospholipase L1-like esterase|nr:SGNH/GDSL hydrolase family protein [Verrucomicrobiales bacterium]
MHRPILLIALALAPSFAFARDMEPKPSDPYFARYEGFKAPAPTGLLLKKGDRLAICGDSITEQKQYSLLMEAYLTACLADLEITARQYGWSGEQAGGFLARMKNDVLRFQPTIATTCYGMNDHRYVPYKDDIGDTYRKNQTAIVQMFKQAGTTVVLGSSGTIASVPGWVKSATGTWEDLNSSLCKLRNIDIEIAEAEKVHFADVFWPMLNASFTAQQKYGKDFAVSGKDGVHPGWAGQVVMASAFLHALGVDGNLGTISVDLAANKAQAEGGQKVRAFDKGKLELTSTRWPFFAGHDPVDKDSSMRAGMALCNFNERFNRIILKVKGITTPRAKVFWMGWGPTEKQFSREQLEAGINIAAEFETGPFEVPFSELWNAVKAKQEFETKQIKEIFHGPQGKADMEAAVKKTEEEHARLAAAIKATIKPVDHTLVIVPVP